MTVQYTDNFNFPLAPDTTENWGAVINGVLEDIDALIHSCDRCVAEGVSVNLNAGQYTETTLYTVPTGYQFYPTKVVLRGFSAAIGTATISVGLAAGGSGANCDEFLPEQTLTNVSAGYADEVLILQPVPNATPLATLLLDAAEVLAVEIRTPEGGALTCKADVFGKLIAVP
jgi:hypothetical protein